MVTLKRFAAIPIQDPDVPPPRINLRPEFEVARNGQATNDWDTSQWSVLDPYGNLQFGWNCDLCPREPAWRLQLSLYRNENAMFDEAEQWTLSGIPRPDADTVNSLEGSKTLAGVTLGAASIGGAGKVTYLSFLPGVSSNSSASYGGSIPKGGLFRIEKKQEMGKSTTSVEADVPHFVVHLAGRTDEHRVFVQVTDDQGRRCQTQPITVDDLEFWFFSPEKDARKFDFRITVQQVRKVEFLVAPPQMPEAQP